MERSHRAPKPRRAAAALASMAAVRAGERKRLDDVDVDDVEPLDDYQHDDVSRERSLGEDAVDEPPAKRRPEQCGLQERVTHLINSR